MSKERLGEAIRAIKSNWPDERYSLLRDALNYVISEAELAKDLEKLREEDSTYYNELLTEVREQNKRLRDGIKGVFLSLCKGGEYDGRIDKWAAFNIIVDIEKIDEDLRKELNDALDDDGEEDEGPHE